MGDIFSTLVGQDLGGQDLALALAVALLAGFVKGAVGFAMPLIMVSAFNGFCRRNWRWPG